MEAPCRHVDPDLLRLLLTRSDLADYAPYGVQIRGARIRLHPRSTLSGPHNVPGTPGLNRVADSVEA